MFTFGERTFTFGERTFTFGDNQGFRFFLEFLFLLLGGFGTPWVRGPRRGLRKYLTQRRGPAKSWTVVERKRRKTNKKDRMGQSSRHKKKGGRRTKGEPKIRSRKSNKRAPQKDKEELCQSDLPKIGGRMEQNIKEKPTKHSRRAAQPKYRALCQKSLQQMSRPTNKISNKKTTLKRELHIKTFLGCEPLGKPYQKSPPHPLHPFHSSVRSRHQNP